MVFQNQLKRLCKDQLPEHVTKAQPSETKAYINVK